MTLVSYPDTFRPLIKVKRVSDLNKKCDSWYHNSVEFGYTKK